MSKTPITTDVRSGASTLNELPEILRKYGTKVLLVHGHRPVEDGLLQTVRLLLNEAGFPHANMGQILPNPKYDSVVRGVEIARKEKCDIILSLGGGSTLQCAKGIAGGLGVKGDLKDLWNGKKKLKKAAVIGAVLTDPASGSELGQKCTLVRGGKRHTMVSPFFKSTFAILDPCESQYPFYPTMNQIFILYARLFFASLVLKDEQKTQALELLKKLVDTAAALSRNIGDIEARTQLFSIGCHAHKDLKLPENPVEPIGEKIAFNDSLPNGTGQSVLFFAWLNTLEDADKNEVIHIANTLAQHTGSDTQVTTFEDALASLKAGLEPTKIPLTLKESGLKVHRKKLLTLAENKEQKAILKQAIELDAR